MHAVKACRHGCADRPPGSNPAAGNEVYALGGLRARREARLAGEGHQLVGRMNGIAYKPGSTELRKVGRESESRDALLLQENRSCLGNDSMSAERASGRCESCMVSRRGETTMSSASASTLSSEIAHLARAMRRRGSASPPANWPSGPAPRVGATSST